MPINSPTGFLDITNATLRTSNVEAENILITGGNIYVTSELEADATVLNLENVTRKGNVSSNTIEITNATTGIVATGNVHALKFIGSGSHLTGIPPTAITGTLSQWSDGANSDVYIASNVGIGNVHTLTSNTLQVGGNLYVRDTDANVLTVNGNVVASYFEGDGSRLSGIVTDLQGVTDNGNVTTNVVQFSNATTGLVTTANIEVGGDIKVVGLSAGTVPYVASDKFLKDSFITMTGDATVITSNLDVTGNIFMRGNKFIVESETKLINDAIIGIANNNTVSTTDKGIIMQNTTGNVAIIHHGTGDGFADQLTFGYTADPLDTVTVTNDLTKELTVNVLGNVITQNNLSIGGLLKINTISAASSHSLQAVTNLGNVTSNTVQFSNAITSLVASSNIVATGNVSAGRNTDTTSYFGRAAVGYMGTSDQASFAHFDRNSSAQYALKQTAAGPTYINTPASGHIRFTVNDGNAGAEKMRITSAGKVGIGVSAPHANLHVEGNVYVSSNLTVSGNVEVGTANLFVDTVNSRVGIGTTTPGAELAVVSAGKQFTDMHIQSNLDFDNTNWIRSKSRIFFRGNPSFTTIDNTNHYGAYIQGGFRDGYNGGQNWSNSVLSFFTKVDPGNDVEAMTITNGGNVGIGTTTPGQKLSIYTGSTNTAALSFDRSSTGNYRTDIYQDSYGADFRVGYGSYTPESVLYLKRMSDGAKRVVINDRLGIGETDPAAALDIGSGGARIHGTEITYDYNASYAYASLTGTASAGTWQSDPGNANYGLYVQNWIRCTAVTLFSDARIKKNIVDINDTYALDKLRQLQPKYYNYIDTISEGEQRVIGFIAQEVKDVIPEAVKITTDFIPNIYELSNVSDSNVITLTNFDTSTLESNVMVLKVYDIENKEHLVNIAEVIDGHSIRVEEDLSEWIGSFDESGNVVAGNHLFVYGQKVTDFNNLNKNCLWTYSTAALQEVDRQLQAEKAKVTTLETQLASVLTRLDALENA